MPIVYPLYTHHIPIIHPIIYTIVYPLYTHLIPIDESVYTHCVNARAPQLLIVPIITSRILMTLLAVLALLSGLNGVLLHSENKLFIFLS